jgi:heme/copper-type cytochrome/quinol oxidase subunit 2
LLVVLVALVLVLVTTVVLVVMVVMVVMVLQRHTTPSRRPPTRHRPTMPRG